MKFSKHITIFVKHEFDCQASVPLRTGPQIRRESPSLTRTKTLVSTIGRESLWVRVC